MNIVNALAGLAVSDFAASTGWYERLFGRAADSTPMPKLAEWRFPRGGWLQIFEQADRAGKGSLTLAVDDRDAVAAHVQQLGIEVGQLTSSDQVRTLSVADPDGNLIVFAEALDPGLAR
ncbi:VOC family protein [Piscinibacter sakaiensis]|uniref:VOC family protein n=1 Tax=Piscinibacter sakaiensis TaxID=1547922 RepID=UPI003AAFD9CC